MTTINVTFSDLLPIQAEALTSLASLLQQSENTNWVDIYLASKGVAHFLDCITDAITTSDDFAGVVTFPHDDEDGDIVIYDNRLATIYRVCNLAATELRSLKLSPFPSSTPK